MRDETSLEHDTARAEALRRLASFVPHAGRAYAARRNHDLGPGRHDAVSGLSPYLRHRVVTEEEVLRAVLGRHSAPAAEKFVQEVYWRTYWKGWMEMRPGIWLRYQRRLRAGLDDVQTQGGLRDAWAAACRGETGITCFDAWARELAETGYLHNHARMWFASIWIFTLRLPWELGADFFLRHLLDGDPAVNTLSWRWVAGLQTRGKTYLARPDNIETYTGGRFHPAPGELAERADPLEDAPHPERIAAPATQAVDPGRRTAFVLHEEDLSPGWILEQVPVAGAAVLRPGGGVTPLEMSPRVTGFRRRIVQETAERLGIETVAFDGGREIGAWARKIGAEQIVTAYAPVGPVAEALAAVEAVPVVRMLRPHDARCWPHATAGFFRFRKKIPEFLGEIRGLGTV